MAFLRVRTERGAAPWHPGREAGTHVGFSSASWPRGLRGGCLCREDGSLACFSRRRFDNDYANLTTRLPSSPLQPEPLCSEKPGLLLSDFLGFACPVCLPPSSPEACLHPAPFSCPLGPFPGAPHSSAPPPTPSPGEPFCWIVLEKGQPSS